MLGLEQHSLYNEVKLNSKANSFTWHADASVATAFVNAGTLVEAGIRLAFVDVVLAATTTEPDRAVAPVRPWRVDALATVLTGGSYI